MGPGGGVCAPSMSRPTGFRELLVGFWWFLVGVVVASKFHPPKVLDCSQGI